MGNFVQSGCIFFNSITKLTLFIIGQVNLVTSLARNTNEFPEIKKKMLQCFLTNEIHLQRRKQTPENGLKFKIGNGWTNTNTGGKVDQFQLPEGDVCVCVKFSQ